MKRETTMRLSIAILLSAGCALPAFAQETAPPAAGQPADICKELISFVKPPAPAEASKQAAAPAAPQQTTAVNAAGGTGDKPNAAAGAAAQNSGMSGPVPQGAKEGVPASTASGGSTASGRSSANAAAKAPATPATATPTKPDEAAVKVAEAAAATNDPAACRAAVRTMRQTGITVPPPLLALAALDPKFFAPR